VVLQVIAEADSGAGGRIFVDLREEIVRSAN